MRDSTGPGSCISVFAAVYTPDFIDLAMSPNTSAGFPTSASPFAPATFSEFFAGAGGWGEGVEMLPALQLKGLFALEWCPLVAAAYQRRFPQVPLLINKFCDTSVWPSLPGAEIWLASPPCTPFSKAGVCKGFADIHSRPLTSLLVLVSAHLPRL